MDKFLVHISYLSSFRLVKIDLSVHQHFSVKVVKSLTKNFLNNLDYRLAEKSLNTVLINIKVMPKCGEQVNQATLLNKLS